MPTGYTAAVQSGKITEFRDFAMACARNFGACDSLRDSSEPIPDEFLVGDWYRKSLDEANVALTTFRTKNDVDLVLEYSRETAENRNEARRQIAEDAEERRRYEAIIAKADAWTPPSPDHVGMKTFMLSQLRESIKFDCGGDYWQRELVKPVRPFAEWKADKLASLTRTLANAAEALAEEEQRVAGRNRWIKQLRESLKSEEVTP